MADLKEYPSSCNVHRDVADVLSGEDVARPLIEASSSGNDTALRKLLSQPQWIKAMFEKPDCIYYHQHSNGVCNFAARPIPNHERALTLAAQNGHTAVVSTLLAFATEQGIDAYDEATARTIIWKVIGISGGHADVLRVLASADPNIVNFRLPHGVLPLYEAARRRSTNVVAVLLEFGADPLNPVQPSKRLGSFHSSLMSFAVFAKGPRMTEMLLEHGTPVSDTGALHTAAGCGELDTMRLLLQHGAGVNETLSNWNNQTPMHFAASKGRVDAMKLLEQHGARIDVKDKDGKTPAQLLEELNTA